MSSLANYYNHSNYASVSEYDDANQCDSSFNSQNESMMHKVKDVVSKIFHPSFLFSASDDTNRSKRKRSSSMENNADEQQTETSTNMITNLRTTTPKHLARTTRDDESSLIDEEDDSIEDVLPTERDLTDIEQQKKGPRTTYYQNIHDDHERMSSHPISTDSIRLLSKHRIDHKKSSEQNYNEIINRVLPSSTQRFHSSLTYRQSTSNYDPSKSPLFSDNNRKPTARATTTTSSNTQSNEFLANHLLATGLIERPQLSATKNQQSSATLTNPTANTNRLLSNERKILGVNYAAINSHRLPYIERLRRRTLQDCIRLNRTLDNEPLSISTIDEHQSKSTSSELKLKKVQEKECGIQCDISNTDIKKNQCTFPPADMQYEALSVPNKDANQPSTQTESPIEKPQVSIPKIDITKPKVLGDVTPLSWPKFARAQEEYAKKYPEKCTNSVPSTSTNTSTNDKSNLINNSTLFQKTSTISNLMPKIPTITFTPPPPPSSSSSSIQSIWKCPSCTKEHPAQTASCSLCHGINPNYKKLSAIASTITVENESVSSTKLPDATTKEPSIPTPITAISNQTTTTTTKENSLSLPSIFTTPTVSLSFNPTPIQLFSTTKENPVTTTTSVFGTTPSISTQVLPPLFGSKPIVSPITVTKENPVPTTTISFLGTPPTTTKESSFTTSTVPVFNTTTKLDKPLNDSTSNQFRFSTSSLLFSSVPPSTSTATIVTTSTAPSTPKMTDSVPMSPISSSSSESYRTFGDASNIATTTPFAMQASTSTSSLAINSTISGSSMVTAPLINTTSSPMSTMTSFPTLNSFTSLSQTTPAPFQFGTAAINVFPASTTIQSNTSSGVTTTTSSSSNFFPLSASSNVGSTFGTNSLFNIGSTSVGTPSNSFSLLASTNNAPFAFSFPSQLNTTINPTQNSIGPVASTSGFPFVPQASSVSSTFGVVPSTLAQGGFRFAGTTPAPIINNQFSPADPSNSSPSGTNPFDITRVDTANGSRPMLRARRRQRN
ncbi:unnamed protein product [Rotaria magnacalcarata]|uniref:RanBP2-type domain-containing protein n=2 Tax=Rotaria magnacalcarata TaxID=392030 RepID=A0A815ABH4_9BILA|nr:unnamed protein product [Rotaria magnacalcarata]CAF1253403.1 unnamed protein product [Rotaria magnacalcarata]CAF3971436.1 unnamed protein product [Rotaria magnacalcarata]